MKLRYLSILGILCLMTATCDSNVTISLEPIEEDKPVTPPAPDPDPDPDPDPEQTVDIFFTESAGATTNPERGLYKAKDIKSSSSALKASDVQARRLEGVTLWYLGFYLTDFMKGDISKSYLDKIQNSFNALRQGGAKCVLRFAYRDDDDGFGTIDQEPERQVVMRHIEQLKPLLQENADVIFVLQAGFIGTWGEWYYTTHFVYQPESNADYQPRKEVCEALLDAMHESRQIELRTPQFKMRLYGLALKDTLTAATAHSGSKYSRLAGHNDCFGASETDYGTFDNEPDDRKFWKADSRYTIMGGETCAPSDYCLCQNSLRDLQDYHWTYLHLGYNKQVLGRWASDGCYDEIVRRLGYRLVLESITRTEATAAGQPCNLTIHLRNDGFAAPMNPRGATLVWVPEGGGKEEFPLGSDPRTWHSGSHTIKATFTPGSAKGTLYLLLDDPMLKGKPEYSIALSNTGVFESSTGYNKLFEIK